MLIAGSGPMIGGANIVKLPDKLCFQVSRDKDPSVIIPLDVVKDEVVNKHALGEGS